MSSIEDAAEIANTIIRNCAEFDCVYYHGDLRKGAEDKEIGAETGFILKVLSSVASYHFRRENAADPYGPLMQTNAGRSPIPSDFSDQELSILSQIAPSINQSVLQARIYDVLWLRRKSLLNAEMAINIYLACSKACFDLEHWTHCAEYAERALRLASIFRKKNPDLAENAAAIFSSWVSEHFESDKKFLTARSIQLLLEFGYGDVSSLHIYAKTIAQIAEQAGDFHRSERYWELAVRAARKLKNSEEEINAQKALAETYVKNANSVSSALQAAHWMQKSIEVYKAIPNSKQRREELYEDLLRYQKSSLGEMTSVDAPYDISGYINQTISSIEGKSFKDAIFALAFGVAKVPNYSALKKQAEDLAGRFPLSHMFGATHLDGEGKVIARSAGGVIGGHQISSHDLYRSAALDHQIIVEGGILPAADIIRVEHPISLVDFVSYASNNPFVAPGQELLWAHGLVAGINGEYEISLPILVPLLENSLRHVLRQHGVRVSTLNTHGVQEELRISAILDHEATEKIFGYDLVMDLKGLLQERTYANLRNVISHGLGSVRTFYSAPAIYLWWLCFRLFLIPIANENSK